MYEDVSAVTKVIHFWITVRRRTDQRFQGWKTNPVDFDSVFNQSSTTFSFGSPDILPIFAHGAIPGRIHTWSYDEDDEDFTKGAYMRTLELVRGVSLTLVWFSEASTLDTWVLKHLETLFQNATSDPSLDLQLRQEKTVFFLHLLGLDVTGHSHRPHSRVRFSPRRPFYSHS
jgi:phosphatidylinositol glycan class N